ncbi:MAG TPA: hypothetical protein VGI39_09865 [Polyangiaceae bacterium]|jgi:hypothetical protein
MAIARFVTPLVFVAAFLVGCSSDDSTSEKQTLTPPAPAPEGTAPASPAWTPVTITVQGKGAVKSDDGAFFCAPSGTPDAGSCTLANWGVTIYEQNTIGWQFDHWEPSMSHDTTMYINSWTPAAVTAVFVQTAIVDAAYPE